MSDNEETNFLNKNKDVYNYDNGHTSGSIGDGSRTTIVENYVTLESKLEAYHLEGKIIKIIENISINEEEKDDENITTIEMKLRDRELIKKNKC